VVTGAERCPRCGVSVRSGEIVCAFCGTVVAEPRVTPLTALRDRGVLELTVLAVVTAVVAVTWVLVLLHR
jgi:uncharacterized membrane protein